ncbi:MAG: hypothetical protein ACYC4L_06865 [Chloroflexota bacterium]
MKAQHELLDEYIDALIESDKAAAAIAGLDPNVANFAHDLEALADDARPRLGFSAELEARLFGAAADTPAHELTPSRLAGSVGGPARPSAPPAGTQPEERPSRAARGAGKVRPFLRALTLAGRLAAAVVLLAVLAGLSVVTYSLARPLLEGRVGPAVAANPRDALVELHFTAGDSRHLQTGVSLGDGLIVTAATWREGDAFEMVEANWGRHIYGEAEVVKVDFERGVALLRTRGALPPSIGAPSSLEKGDEVRLLGREGPESLPASRGQSPEPTSVLSVRAAEGKLFGTGVSLPDARGTAPAEPPAGPFLQVHVAAWPGLVGGLVLDSADRPAGLVVQVITNTSGVPGIAYALPLSEVKGWATGEVLEATPVPGPSSVELVVTYRWDGAGGTRTLLPGQTAVVPLPESSRAYQVEVRLPKEYDSQNHKVVIAPDPELFVMNSGAGKDSDWGRSYLFALGAPGMRRDGPAMVGTPVPGVINIDVQGVKQPDGSPAELKFTLQCGLQQAPVATPDPRANLDKVAGEVGFPLYLPIYLPAGVGLSSSYTEYLPSEGQVVALVYDTGSTPAWGPSPAVGFTLFQSKPRAPLVITVPPDRTIARPMIGEAEAVLYANPFPAGTYGATTALQRIALAWTSASGMHFELSSTLSADETIAVARSLRPRAAGMDGFQLTSWKRVVKASGKFDSATAPDVFVVEEYAQVRTRVWGVSRVDVVLGLGASDRIVQASGVPDKDGIVEVRVRLPKTGVQYVLQAYAVLAEQRPGCSPVRGGPNGDECVLPASGSLPVMWQPEANAATAKATAVVKPSSELDEAHRTLLSFFSALNRRDYVKAVTLYGGTYEPLREWNPALPADDYAALWRNACEINGVRCLQVGGVLDARQVAEGEFMFVVQFANEDGSVFVSGPCCGATPEQMPPRSEFEYTVKKTASGYVVLGGPVYVP